MRQRRLFHRGTTRGQRRRVSLNFVQVDLYTVFSDSVNIVERWLKHSNENVENKQLPWHQIANHRPSYETHTSRRLPKSQICPNWTNEHFSRSQNCLQVPFWSLNFVILLNLRDTRGDRMCRNELKQRTLMSLGIYKHCNVPSDS